MKNNILIIVGVTVVAIGVIIAVIIASILNSGEESNSDSTPSQISIPSADESDDYYEPDSVSSDDESSEDIPDDIDSEPYDVTIGIIATANSLIGIPFEENGDNPNGFDNSGFIYYVLRENGYITCPRTTQAQAEMGSKLAYSQLREGDLVFFKGEDSENASFGGIYIGDDQMIACLMPGQTVRIVDISVNYYQTNFFCGIGLS